MEKKQPVKQAVKGFLRIALLFALFCAGILLVLFSGVLLGQNERLQENGEDWIVVRSEEGTDLSPAEKDSSPIQELTPVSPMETVE